MPLFFSCDDIYSLCDLPCFFLCHDAMMQLDIMFNFKNEFSLAASVLVKMTHEYNTRGKKNIAVTTDLLKSLEDNIRSNINSLRDNFNRLKYAVIKRFQGDNAQLRV